MAHRDLALFFRAIGEYPSALKETTRILYDQSTRAGHVSSSS